MSFTYWASRRGCQFALTLTAIVSSALFSTSLLAAEPAASPWEKEIRAFEAKDQQQPPPGGAVLFVGSSSIRLWKLDESFPDVKTINRGFGGSHLADSVAFAERIVIPYRPKLIVLYAGDNDLAAGKTPERVLADFKQFVAKVEAALPETRIAFISIKPLPQALGARGSRPRNERVDRRVHLPRRAAALHRRLSADAQRRPPASRGTLPRRRAASQRRRLQALGRSAKADAGRVMLSKSNVALPLQGVMRKPKALRHLTMLAPT